jgi:Cu2+-exporting ATPase
MSANTLTVEKERTRKYTRHTFPVLEMTCAACAVSVESMLKTAPGVKDAGVNFANQPGWNMMKRWPNLLTCKM